MNFRHHIGPCVLVVALASCTALAARAAGERAALYEGGERAKLLVARLTAETIEGAGIVFDVDDRFIYGVTARHVVFQQGKLVTGIAAQLQAWPGPRLPVEVHKLHPQEDVAVFRAEYRSLGISRDKILQGIPLDQLGVSTELDPGDLLEYVGHSTAGSWLTPKAPVRFAQGDAASFQFELDCPPGHSGGAVFDAQWHLVGMMTREERPYCRALRIEPILKIVQGWKLESALRLAPSLHQDGPAPRRITAAVIGFDNRSTKSLPALGAVAQDITTEFLFTLPGVTLVSRDRLADVRGEIKLPDSVDTSAGISRVGKLLNADVLVTGSIIGYDVERRTFEGFGTSALQDLFRMSISLQILDVATARVQFAKTFNVEHTEQYPLASSAPAAPIDLTSRLLTTLLETARPDLRNALAQVTAGLDVAHQFLDVPVATVPAGADVLLNGTNLGQTPIVLQLSQGIHEITFELLGYETKKMRINVQPGRRVDVNLSPKSRP